MLNINDPYDQYDEEGHLKPTQREVDYAIAMKKKMIDGWEHQIKLSEAMARLVKNDDFELVINEYYLKDYLNNRLEDYASSIAPDSEKSAQDKVKAVGCFRVFIKNMLTAKAQAEREIESIKVDIQTIESMETREEI